MTPPVLKTRRVAVLGAGIMGCSLALFFARRGVRVTLVDEAPVPFAGASRWNEGKIHLGYLYAGDPSLATARKVLGGGLEFGSLVEELTSCSLERVITPEDDIFLTHRASVASADEMAAYFAAVSALVREHPGAGRYLADASAADARALTRAELDAVSGSADIVAGFRVPERSVQTNWIADRFVEAVNAEPNIEFAPGTHVTGVEADGDGWRVQSTPPLPGTFDVVVNALWHGRLAVDRTSGLPPEGAGSNRYRMSLFVHTSRLVETPSAVIATGPFGDVKNYNNRDFYLSWYPSGLVAEGEGNVLPDLPAPLPKAEVEAGIWRELACVLPGTEDIAAAAAETRVEGGWVFAQGRGTLDDPASPLHKRDRFGVRRTGSYFSVDTGKYSTAPWLARSLVAEICG